MLLPAVATAARKRVAWWLVLVHLGPVVLTDVLGRTAGLLRGLAGQDGVRRDLPGARRTGRRRHPAARVWTPFPSLPARPSPLTHGRSSVAGDARPYRRADGCAVRVENPSPHRCASGAPLPRGE
ncbi:hypothetical protein [Streptomyces sp. NPDC001508]|uniref:hypothetical protein n=1 Tax=Streptomyces sp. NPDC001508 TaxID=3154656 RepID=UPI00331F26FF